MFENIESFLSNNNELAWIAIFMFAFMESFILSGYPHNKECEVFGVITLIHTRHGCNAWCSLR